MVSYLWYICVHALILCVGSEHNYVSSHLQNYVYNVLDEPQQ